MQFVDIFCKSFIKNKISPRSQTEPWGIPQLVLTLMQSDKQLSYSIHLGLPTSI